MDMQDTDRFELEPARAGALPKADGRPLIPEPLPVRLIAIDHAALTFLLDRNGRYVAFFPPGTRPERMATMLQESL